MSIFLGLFDDIVRTGVRGRGAFGNRAGRADAQPGTLAGLVGIRVGDGFAQYLMAPEEFKAFRAGLPEQAVPFGELPVPLPVGVRVERGAAHGSEVPGLLDVPAVSEPQQDKHRRESHCGAEHFVLVHSSLLFRLSCIDLSVSCDREGVNKNYGPFPVGVSGKGRKIWIFCG